MPNSLTQRLSKNLGLDVSDIEPALSNYLADLLALIRTGKTKEIPGFGSFYLSAGEIVFDADPVLVEAVNFRYQHLDALRTRAAVEADKSLAVAPVEEPLASSVQASLKVELLLEETVSDVKDAPNDTSERSAKRTEREPVGPRKTVRRSVKSSRSGDGTTSSRRRTTLLIVIPLVAVAAVIAAVSYFDRERSETYQEPQETPGEMVGSDDLAAGTGSEAEQIRTETDISGDSVSSSTQSPPPPTQPTREAVSNEVAENIQNAFLSDFDRSSPGYTLIIGSVFSVADAASEMARYDALDLPRAVLAYEDEGITRFRLAVGQYESIERAQAGMEQLGNQIPEGTWIRRIR